MSRVSDPYGLKGDVSTEERKPRLNQKAWDILPVFSDPRITRLAKPPTGHPLEFIACIDRISAFLGIKFQETRYAAHRGRITCSKPLTTQPTPFLTCSAINI
jgi:hypothetical protein